MHQEDRIAKFTFKKATFENIPQKVKEIIEQSEEIKTTLKSEYWYIEFGQFEQYNWPQILPYMNKCHTQEIHLSSNNRVQIISQIQHVQFINLKYLNLGKNKINNIQNLCFINFNCLQNLYLHQNQISQIKFLQKISAPFLSYGFRISQNPLNQINALIKSKINSKCLNYLYLQEYSQSNPLHQDLSCLIKLSSESVKYILSIQNKRIKQVKVQSKLKSRFPDLQFYK